MTAKGYPARKPDKEGITLDCTGGYWIASEIHIDRFVPHAIRHVNADGVIKEEVGILAELIAVEGSLGFEGITRVGDTLWMALQRAWADDRAWVLLPVVRKENIRDLNLELAAQDGYALGKVAGLAIFKDRSNWASMDNDGVDDSSSETFFWKIGT